MSKIWRTLLCCVGKGNGKRATSLPSQKAANEEKIPLHGTPEKENDEKANQAQTENQQQPIVTIKSETATGDERKESKESEKSDTQKLLKKTETICSAQKVPDSSNFTNFRSDNYVNPYLDNNDFYKGCSPEEGLLSPPTKENQHKKCIVLDLDETLVHSSFKPVAEADFIVPVNLDGVSHEVYVMKRPRVDEFLRIMSELFECVLFTASLAKYADPVSDYLDPSGKIFGSHRLFRESCSYTHEMRSYVKDLSKLGRPVDQTIIIDNSPHSYMFQPENGIPITTWFDDMSDVELTELIEPLRTIAAAQNVYEGFAAIGGKGNLPFFKNTEMHGYLAQPGWIHMPKLEDNSEDDGGGIITQVQRN